MEVCWFLFVSVSATLIKSGSTSTCFPCQTCHMLVLTFLACGGALQTFVTAELQSKHPHNIKSIITVLRAMSSESTPPEQELALILQVCSSRRAKGWRNLYWAFFTKSVFVCCCVNPKPLLSSRTSVFLFKPHGSWWICDELPLLFTDLEAVVLFLGTGEI